MKGARIRPVFFTAGRGDSCAKPALVLTYQISHVPGGTKHARISARHDDVWYPPPPPSSCWCTKHARTSARHDEAVLAARRPLWLPGPPTDLAASVAADRLPLMQRQAPLGARRPTATDAPEVYGPSGLQNISVDMDRGDIYPPCADRCAPASRAARRSRAGRRRPATGADQRAANRCAGPGRARRTGRRRRRLTGPRRPGAGRPTRILRVRDSRSRGNRSLSSCD